MTTKPIKFQLMSFLTLKVANDIIREDHLNVTLDWVNTNLFSGQFSILPRNTRKILLNENISSIPRLQWVIAHELAHAKLEWGVVGLPEYEAQRKTHGHDSMHERTTQQYFRKIVERTISLVQEFRFALDNPVWLGAGDDLNASPGMQTE